MYATALRVFDTYGGSVVTAIDIYEESRLMLAGYDKGNITLIDLES